MEKTLTLTIDELLKGKATIIKGETFLETRAYVEPFLEKMSKFTNDFRIKVNTPDQMTIDCDAKDVTFNRVWVQAVMPAEYNFDGHSEVTGLVYGLDTKAPVAKIYRGGINQACTNLCIFNPSFLNVQEMKPSTKLNYRSLTNLLETTDDMKLWLDKLRGTPVDCSEQSINENVGRWVRNCIASSFNSGYGNVKISESLASKAYKSLFLKKNSPYYVEPKNNTNMFNVYNAFTDLITNDNDKDIMNKCEKTILLKDILCLE